MQKNRIQFIQKRMLPSYTYTADVAVNQQHSPQDMEDDICPVCESECTCDQSKRSSSHMSLHILSGSSVQESIGSHQNLGSQPSLKIKLAVPSKLLARPRGAITSANHAPPQFSPASHHMAASGEFPAFDPRLRNHLLDPTVPKRRGRPPKVVVAAREAAKVALTAAAASSSQDGIQIDSTVFARDNGSTSRGHVGTKSALFRRKAAKPSLNPKIRSSTSARAAPPRKRPVHDHSRHPRGSFRRTREVHNDIDEDDDVDSLRFPIFISASSSSASSSSSPSSSDVESSDSEEEELRMEEESYIMDSEQEKKKKERHYERARVKRELFGESDSKQKAKFHHVANRWEIKPRRKSVAGSDVDADADMDTETDDDSTAAGDDESEGKSGEEDEDTDGNEVDRDGRKKLGVSFAGVVTGWSDGEDSSYDADLFFANLDGSDSDSDSTMTLGNSSMDADGEDAGAVGGQESGDDVDEAMSLVAAAGFDGLSFDVASGWDGGFVFAGDLGDFDVDMTTELRAQSHTDNANSLHLRYQPTSDLDLFSSSFLTSVEDVLPVHHSQDHNLETDEDYNGSHDGVELAESDGETTEEELVGVDGLPNARAMMLFRWPVSIGSVDPMYTLSPASRSVNAVGRVVANAEGIQTDNSHTRPEPTSISRDEHNEADCGETSSARSFDGELTPSRTDAGISSKSASRKARKAPAFGFFEVASDHADPFNGAVIDGRQPQLPSPYPKTKQSSKPSKNNGKSHRRVIRDRSLSLSGQSSVFSDKILSTPSQSTDFDMFSAESLDIDEVLNAAFLTSEPSTSDIDSPATQHEEQDIGQFSLANSGRGTDAGRHMNNLSRWDRIPMTTFRRTRETRNSTLGKTRNAKIKKIWTHFL